HIQLSIYVVDEVEGDGPVGRHSQGVAGRFQIVELRRCLISLEGGGARVKRQEVAVARLLGIDAGIAAAAGTGTWPRRSLHRGGVIPDAVGPGVQLACTATLIGADISRRVGATAAVI